MVILAQEAAIATGHERAPPLHGTADAVAQVAAGIAPFLGSTPLAPQGDGDATVGSAGKMTVQRPQEQDEATGTAGRRMERRTQVAMGEQVGHLAKPLPLPGGNCRRERNAQRRRGKSGSPADQIKLEEATLLGEEKLAAAVSGAGGEHPAGGTDTDILPAAG